MSRLLSLALLVSLALGGRAAEPVGAEFFEKKIRPILAEQCHGCHSAQVKQVKSDLRLDSRAGLLKGGARGPAIVAGAPEKSRLIEAVSYKNVDLQMPPRGKLSDAAIADLTAWVKMGAPWPGGDTTAAAVEKKPGFDLQKRKAEHWCWQPVQHVAPPAVRDNSWPLVPADRFILAKLEAAGLRPAPPADRRTWLRRVTFDLIGLPPTPDEIDAFLKDVSPRAYASVVDRLLASPHFGERWARHWLDLVRYAETKGHEFDPIIPNAYQYRDYVIRALNADVPYNQFVTEHIAGDLLREPRMSGPDGFNESVLGTGFWFLGEEVHSPVDIRADECDRIDNKIDVFSKTFLALTVSCARCHDHKFDAISQKDYYALSGFLLSSSYRQVRFDSDDQNKRVSDELEELRNKHGPAVLKVLAETIKPGAERIKANLLGAREAIRAGKAGDTDELRAWVKHLHLASKNPEDPFYLWAILCANSGPSFAARWKSLEKQNSDQFQAAHRSRENCETIATIGGRHKEQAFWSWDDGFDMERSDGIIWGTDVARPILRFKDRTGIDLDPFWNGLTEPPGTEHDHGVLGAVPRYGRLIRTAKFSLSTGKLYLLIKGRARVYAAVDSHKLIAGPLHARLVKEFDTGGRWQWVSFDLRPYAGHRLHLEISPIKDESFSISEVIESETQPLLEPPIVSPGNPTKYSLEELADFYYDWLYRVIYRNWTKFEYSDPFDGRLTNLVLERPELFGVRDFSAVSRAAGPLFVAQEKLARAVRRVSRLAPAIVDVSHVNEQLHIRGSHKALGEVVPRRLLEAFVGRNGVDSTHGQDVIRFFAIYHFGSGRDFVAQQVTDPSINPLVARVIVNRVWHHLFGRGIVASVDNFGVMGDRPTHPELLDFLAERFVEQGWSIKRLIRELVLSATYQQASSPSPAADPENKLLHAGRIKRLEGEVIRDAMLALSGRLDPKVEGAPVPIYLGNIPEARGRPNVDGPLDGAGRRSIYIAVRRNFLSPFMLAFDTPSPFSTMGRRSVSNVPAQALILMNDPFVHQQAERWGRRVAAEPGDVGAKVEQMYQSAFARRPNADELQRARDFVKSRGGDARAWGDLAHVLFNVKEFIYLP